MGKPTLGTSEPGLLTPRIISEGEMVFGCQHLATENHKVFGFVALPEDNVKHHAWGTVM
jgi:hypothetical protein